MSLKPNTSNIKKPEIKEFLLKEYDTVCDIINEASEKTSKNMSVSTTIVLAILSLIISSTFIIYSNDFVLSGKPYFIMIIIYFSASIIFTISFFVAHYRFYKRQAVYRVLKEKILNDITTSNYNKDIIATKKYYYKFIIKIAQNDFFIKNFKAVVKETWLYLLCCGFYIAILVCLLTYFFGISFNWFGETTDNNAFNLVIQTIENGVL